MDKLKNKKSLQNSSKNQNANYAVSKKANWQNKLANNLEKQGSKINFYGANNSINNSKNNALNNVVKFSGTSPEVLTETEINNLFLGFVRLIKKNVVIEKEEHYKQTIAELKIKLQKTESEVESLRE